MASKVSGIVEKIQSNGSSGTSYAIASTAYGYCQTAANQPAKVVDMTGFTLYEGVTIHIKFQYNNTASSPTLNINDTGAKPIVQYGTTAISTGDATSGWYAGAVVSFTYDGTSWVRDQGFNTNSQSAYGNITTSGTLDTALQAVVTDSNKKITTADLTVSDDTTIDTTATSFVAKVTQSAQGKITVTKANLPTASTSVAGITKVGASGGAAAYNHNHDPIYSAIHQTTWNWASDGTEPLSKYVTFDANIAAGNTEKAPDAGWYNGFVTSHGNYLASFILNKHRTDKWYVGWEQYPKDGSTAYTEPTWYLLAHSGNISTGDNSGEIKIAGINVKVKDIGGAAYKAANYYALASHGTHVTTETVKSALGATANPTAKKFLKDTGSWVQVDWGDLTGIPSSFTPSSHTHDYLNSKGNVTAETEGNKPAQKGLSMQNAYNNGYPTAYGNVLTMYGAGATQLFMGWSGSSNSTTGVHADAYIRSQRDTNGSLWSDWAKLLDTANYKTYTVSSIAGLQGDVTLAQLGLSSALRYQGTTTTAMEDGRTTAAVTIGGNSFTPTQGDVVIYNDAEYVWTGSLWELLGAESSFKKVQTAVSSSSASGNSATTFVSSVTQDTQGVITVKTSTLNTSGTWSGTATYASYIKSPDTRAVEIAPQDLDANSIGVRFDFKQKSITSLKATYSGVMSYRPYSHNNDWSGGPAHQLAFDENGMHWRKSTDSTTWGTWNQLVTITDQTAVGDTNTPVYVDANGIVQACTAYANASVNYANSADKVNAANLTTTTNALAYYTNTTGTFGNASKITVYNDADITVQGATKKCNGLHLYGTTYGNTASDLTSNTVGVMRFEDGGPRIEFSETNNESDSGAILFTNHDYANTGGGSSFHFVGKNSSNNTGGNLAVTAPDFVARRRMAVGYNFTDASYALKVLGASLFSGNFEIRANTIRLRNGNNDNNQAGSNPYITSLMIGDSTYVAFNEFHDDWLAIQSKGLVLNVRNSPIAVYNAAKTYAVGDVVWYDKNYYICKTAIETAEAWNANHWTIRNPSGAILSEASIIPWSNNTYTLGNSSYKWNDIYTTTLNTGYIKIPHTAGSSAELQITYSTTIDYWWGVGTANVNHGMYDNKANKWIISAVADNKWNFDGNASSADTATTAKFIKFSAGNEIRFDIDTKPTSATDIYIGFKWSDATGDAKINGYKFCNGNGGNLAKVYASEFVGPLNGNASTASKITNMTTNDAASNSDVWRRIWISYSNNVEGRPAYTDNFCYQTSTNTLKAGKYLINSKVRLEYNTTDDSLDFVFI